MTSLSEIPEIPESAFRDVAEAQVIVRQRELEVDQAKATLDAARQVLVEAGHRLDDLIAARLEWMCKNAQ